MKQDFNQESLDKYKKAMDWQKQNPNASMTEVKNTSGLAGSTFYKIRGSLAGKRSYKKTGKYKRPIVHSLVMDDRPITSSRVVAFVGNIQDVTHSIKEFLR